MARDLQELDQQLHALGTSTLVNLVKNCKQLFRGLIHSVCMDLDEHGPVHDCVGATDGLWSDLALFIWVPLRCKFITFWLLELSVEADSLEHFPLIESMPNAEYHSSLIMVK